MLTNIFKTIFILSLCIGITLPSYSAISVSDGSAFVSKAEFAADVNALSNRMAQLENNLDSKIDSLVSTYLNKNGIWNPKRQTMTTYTGFNNAVTQNHFQTMYRTGTRANLNSIIDGKSDSTYNLVNSIDKSGLVNVIFNTSGSAIVIQTTGTGFSGKYINGSSFTGHNYFRDLLRYSGAVSANLYVNGNSVYTTTIMKADLRIDEAPDVYSYDAAWYLIYQPKAFSAFFFANKGDSISWNVLYYASYGEIATTMSITLRGTAFKIKFDSVSVY